MKSARCIRLLGFFLLFLPFQVGAQFPVISLIKQIGGLSFPVHINHAGDGSGRLFIVEQPGRIRIVKNGILLATSFLDISSTGANRVLFSGEQGLLSVAFPPGFKGKGYFYVYYTNLNGDNVAARYFLTANPDVVDPNSEVILRIFSHPLFTNHNGGQLAFGPDGFLYIGIGDGGSGGDPNNNGQNSMTFLGKILRIDVESVVNPRIDTYVIPPSNPFVATQGFLPEIWALGLRNPFRFSFDRLTGDLYIGDVGQNLFEEIDFQPAASLGGENYGWNVMEGLHCFNVLNFNNPLPTCNQTGLTLPVFEYGHTQGDCSVCGGFVYRGNLRLQMRGIYFYGDFCSGRIWGLKRNGAVWQNNLLLDSPLLISSLGEDEAGELYLADYVAGDIYRISAPVTKDFNRDGQEDILWRYYGPGGYNYVWYMGQSGGIGGLQTMSFRQMDMFQSPAAAKVYLDAREAGGLLERTADKIYKDAWEAAGPRSSKKALTISAGQFSVPGHAVEMQILKSPMENMVGIEGLTVLGGASLSPVLDTSWQIAGTGDFNGDGKVDILWRYYGGGAAQGLNYVWYMDGVMVMGGALLPTISDTSWQIGTTGDFNGDGKVDILWRYCGGGATQGANYVWYMDGVTVTGGALLPTISDTSWQIGGTGDFNGDGKVDILWRNYSYGLNYVWYMDGVTATGGALLPTISDTNWQIGGTGDFNGDGKVDILWRSYSYGLNYVWYMDGVTCIGGDLLVTIGDLNWRIVNR